MKRVLIRYILLLCLLQSHSSSYAQAAPKTPLEFNDHIAGITDSLFAQGQQWGKSFNDAYTSKDFASLTPVRIALEQFITGKIAEVKKMKDVKNSKELRTAMITFLEFEETMVAQAFIPIERLDTTATEDDIKTALGKLAQLTQNEGAELQKVAVAQDAYAKSNGFAIESKQTEK